MLQGSFKSRADVVLIQVFSRMQHLLPGSTGRAAIVLQKSSPHGFIPINLHQQGCVRQSTAFSGLFTFAFPPLAPYISSTHHHSRDSRDARDARDASRLIKPRARGKGQIRREMNNPGAAPSPAK
ncbi:hypothetical protein Baya_16784 [Bagarius yarrelli]|uniref:Uncharacterized protein n=1 Tax=Bagarius yarrelli TaxID=175774 RepID=A0A556VWL8_BAGYA|nr:hypothetical protein Baya_16784 [Bagarius yarrelli]